MLNHRLKQQIWKRGFSLIKMTFGYNCFPKVNCGLFYWPNGLVDWRNAVVVRILDQNHYHPQVYHCALWHFMERLPVVYIFLSISLCTCIILSPHPSVANVPAWNLYFLKLIIQVSWIVQCLHVQGSLWQSPNSYAIFPWVLWQVGKISLAWQPKLEFIYFYLCHMITEWMSHVPFITKNNFS